MIYDRIHIKIRRVREANGYSQTAMAQELGIGRTTYVNFETGRTNLFCRTLRLMAQKLEISEEQIIMGEKPEGDTLSDVDSQKAREKAIVDDYESRLSQSNDKLEAAERLIKAHEFTIKTLSETNEFLIKQLHPEE